MYLCFFVVFYYFIKVEAAGFFTLLFSHLADAFIQSDLQIRKSNKL